MDAKKAFKIFGKEPSTSSTSQRSSQGVTENQRLSKESLNYKSLNESLLRKITQTKAQLTQSEKIIEKLRDENQQLRQRNGELSEACDEEKIEIIVAQRLQAKLANISAIGQRTIQFLQNAGMDMKEALKEIEPETKPHKMKRERKKLSADPFLERVEESPLKRAHSQSGQPSSDFIELDSSSDETENLEKSVVQEVERKVKGRRSALLDVKHLEVATPRATLNPPKRAPLLIKPKSPTKNTKDIDCEIKSAPKSANRKARGKKSDSDGFALPATPVQAASYLSFDSTRTQRAAKMKVQSLKEPSLGKKLRNPGRFDEPVPNVDGFLYH